MLVLFRLDMFSEAIDDHDLGDADDGGPLGPVTFLGIRHLLRQPLWPVPVYTNCVSVTLDLSF